MQNAIRLQVLGRADFTSAMAGIKPALPLESMRRIMHSYLRNSTLARSCEIIAKFDDRAYKAG
jgi:hypothetical protein